MAIYRWSIKGRYASGVATVTSLHFVTQPPALGDEPSAGDVLNAINTGLWTLYHNCLPTSWTEESTEVSEMLSPLDLTTVPRGHVNAGSGAGTFSEGDHILPEALCAIVALRTGVPRRWARGYIAMPSPKNSGALTDKGRWAGSYLTNLQALASHLDDDYSIGTVSVTSVIPVVYSRTQHARGADQPWAQVEAGVVRGDSRWRRTRTTAP